MKRVLVVITLIAATFLMLPVTHAADLKLGLVNVQEVLDTIEEGRGAKSQLEKAVLDRKKALESQQKEYRRLEESYEKQKLVLAPAALEEKRKALETKRADLQRSLVTAQSDMQKKEMELTGSLLKKIRAVVEKLGRKGGYTLILEKNEVGVVYSVDGYDVTQQVIREYNKVYKK